MDFKQLKLCSLYFLIKLLDILHAVPSGDNLRKILTRSQQIFYINFNSKLVILIMLTSYIVQLCFRILIYPNVLLMLDQAGWNFGERISTFQVHFFELQLQSLG